MVFTVSVTISFRNDFQKTFPLSLPAKYQSTFWTRIFRLHFEFHKLSLFFDFIHLQLLVIELRVSETHSSLDLLFIRTNFFEPLRLLRHGRIHFKSKSSPSFVPKRNAVPFRNTLSFSEQNPFLSEPCHRRRSSLSELERKSEPTHYGPESKPDSPVSLVIQKCHTFARATNVIGCFMQKY